MNKSYLVTISHKFTLVIFYISLFTSLSLSANNNLNIYLDADRSGAKASGLSIEQGIRTALSEVNNTIGGKKVNLVIRDHHGNAARSLMHLQEFIQDKNALVVFSGLHSTPLLENLNLINNNQILLLDPWAAAGPITRGKSKENWVFRLSIDDTKAGSVIVNSALKEGFKKPYLLLESTGWGKSNVKTMTKALKKQALVPHGIEWFKWNISLTAAKIKLRQIVNSGADAILLVANANEGKTFAKAMLTIKPEQRLPVRSHWGITGGNFTEVITAKDRAQIDLKFLQTRFSFISSPATKLSKQALQQASKLFPQLIKSAKDIKAPTGFIHGYDLTRILIAASSKGLTGNTKQMRLQIKQQLENLPTKVNGLIKTYHKPFSPYNINNLNAHEALSSKDFVMAYYDDKDQIRLVNH